jgi:hypothetical protein
VRRSLLAAWCAAILACTPSDSAAPAATDTTTSSAEAQIPLDTPRAESRPARPIRQPRLSAAADSIGQRSTFVARNTTVLTAATRGGRWLVDLGRVDVPVRTAERLAAYREAAAVLSPLRVGDTLHVYGPWGASRTTVTGYDIWSGRIVGTMTLPAEAESLATLADQRARAPGGADSPFGAAAFRFPLSRDTAQAVSCTRDSITSELAARADSVADSLRAVLLADTASAAPQYRAAPRIVVSRLTGCFGPARVLVLVALRSGGDLLTRERAALIAEDGGATALPVHDFRFRAHALLHVLDADGDGVDDVVARGYGRRVGSLVILRLDPAAPSLIRLTGGFAYEG